MIKLKWKTLADLSEEKKSAIRMDIRKYLKGEKLQMKEIAIKHDISPFLTQRLMQIEIGITSKTCDLKPQLQYS